MNNVMEQIHLNALVPVIVLESANQAVPLAGAILRGGLNVAEVTFRTACAAEAIANMTAAYPDMLVGAGTVLTVADARRAVEAGAKFIVSPGFDADVVAWCQQAGVPVIPGITTATEVQRALAMGLDTVKLYPANLLGAGYVKALSDVYPNLKIMTTGGIGLDNMQEYFQNTAVTAVGGSWLCPKNLIREGQFEKIEEIIRNSINRLFEFKLLHIGLNSQDAQQAQEFGSAFATMFNLPLIELPGAYFAGTMMEIVKKPFLGAHGHIAISTRYMDRAMAYFERRGYSFRPAEGERKDLVAVYFQQEVGGFAIHLRKSLDE